MQQLQQGGSFDDQEYYNLLQKTHETRFKLDSQSANIQRIWKQTGLYETEFLYSNRSSLQIRMSVAPSLDALNVAISGSFVTHHGLAAILAHIMHIAKPLGPSGPSLLQDSFLNSSVALRQALDRVLVQEIVHNIAGSVKFEYLTVGEAVDTAKHYFAHQSSPPTTILRGVLYSRCSLHNNSQLIQAGWRTSMLSAFPERLTRRQIFQSRPRMSCACL